MQNSIYNKIQIQFGSLLLAEQFVNHDTMLLRPILHEVFVVELGGDRRPVWTG